MGRELLIEIIASKSGPLDETTIPRVMDELYALGIRPDWWKLEPQTSAAVVGAVSTRRSGAMTRIAGASCCWAWRPRPRS